jgi:glucokinase
MPAVVTVDIGGTHARFAVADLAPGQLPQLRDAWTAATADYDNLDSALRAYGAALGHALPTDAAIAVAGPVAQDDINLSNAGWRFRQTGLKAALGLERLLLLNDFGAIGYAVDALPPTSFGHICGPDRGLPSHGVISIVGPGTGLGVGLVARSGATQGEVIDTEGGHASFAPHDPFETQLLGPLMQKYGRVSIERIVSGKGLTAIYAALGGTPPDEKTLWAQAISADDARARQALDLWCRALGAASGDVALTQGARALVLAGGLIPRFPELFKSSGFAHRFVEKGRSEAYMRNIPVYLCTYPQPGLLGAAIAFARQLPLL